MRKADVGDSTSHRTACAPCMLLRHSAFAPEFISSWGSFTVKPLAEIRLIGELGSPIIRTGPQNADDYQSASTNLDELIRIWIHMAVHYLISFCFLPSHCPLDCGFIVDHVCPLLKLQLQLFAEHRVQRRKFPISDGLCKIQCSSPNTHLI